MPVPAARPSLLLRRSVVGGAAGRFVSASFPCFVKLRCLPDPHSQHPSTNRKIRLGQNIARTILYMGTLPYEKATVPRMMLNV